MGPMDRTSEETEQRDARDGFTKPSLVIYSRKAAVPSPFRRLAR